MELKRIVTKMDIITVLRIIQLGLLIAMLIIAINMLRIVNRSQKKIEKILRGD